MDHPYGGCTRYLDYTGVNQLEQLDSSRTCEDPILDEPQYGWRRLLSSGKPGETDEDRVAYTVSHDAGVLIEKAGSRTQSYDLEIKDRQRAARAYLAAFGIETGKYEVKSLWRKNEKSAFDRRFKIGTRGEKVYGQRDAAIKAFALALENEIDSIIEHSVDDEGVKVEAGTVQKFVEETHEFIDRAIGRKHAKSFSTRLERLAKAARSIPNLRLAAQRVLDTEIQGHDIVRGFDDLHGIFVVAGPMYTLITKAEMPDFLFFDSASSEGPKLWLAGVIQSNPIKTRKEKGKKKNV
jgi:hypothetical protein